MDCHFPPITRMNFVGAMNLFAQIECSCVANTARGLATKSLKPACLRKEWITEL